MRLLLLLYLLFCASLCTSVAQVCLQGQVINMEKAPIADAVVTVIESGGHEAVFSVVTDSLGKFAVPSCPEQALLDVAAYGYQDSMLAVEPREYVNRLFTMQLAYVSIDEVEVTARLKPRMSREGNKVLFDKLENSPHAKSNDMYSFMRFIPVLKTPMFGGDISLRETAGGCAVLLVNGKHIDVPMDIYLRTVKVENVERIEVIAHPMGEYKVNGSCGVINLAMKKREDEGLQYNLYLSDTQRRENSQQGTFSVNYTNKRIYLTSGVYANNVMDKTYTDTEYKFYTTRQRLQEQGVFKQRSLVFNGYFNLDYELNGRNALGLRLGAGGYDGNDRSMTTSEYAKLQAAEVDSFYYSESKTSTPDKFTGANVNLNYTWKVDDKGSMFYADLDYVLSRSGNDTYNEYSDAASTFEATTMDNILQQNKTHIHSYGAWVRYNHVFNNHTKLNSNLSFYTSRSRYDYAYWGNADEGYVKDDSQCTDLDYDDHALMASVTLDKRWGNNVQLMLGLVLDVYGASGKMDGESISRDEVFFVLHSCFPIMLHRAIMPCLFRSHVIISSRLIRISIRLKNIYRLLPIGRETPI